MMQLLMYELKFWILARIQPFHYMPQLEGSPPPLYLRDTLMSSSYGHLQDWPKILLKLEYLPKYCQNWAIIKILPNILLFSIFVIFLDVACGECKLIWPRTLNTLVVVA